MECQTLTPTLLSFRVWTKTLNQPFCFDSHWEARIGIFPGLWGLLTQSRNCQVDGFMQCIFSSLVENGGNISWRSIHLEGNSLGIILGIVLGILTIFNSHYNSFSWWKNFESLKLKNLKFTEDMAKSGLEQWPAELQFLFCTMLLVRIFFWRKKELWVP